MSYPKWKRYAKKYYRKAKKYNKKYKVSKRIGAQMRMIKETHKDKDLFGTEDFYKLSSI